MIIFINPVVDNDGDDNDDDCTCAGDDNGNVSNMDNDDDKIPLLLLLLQLMMTKKATVEIIIIICIKKRIPESPALWTLQVNIIFSNNEPTLDKYLNIVRQTSWLALPGSCYILLW